MHFASEGFGPETSDLVSGGTGTLDPMIKSCGQRPSENTGMTCFPDAINVNNLNKSNFYVSDVTTVRKDSAVAAIRSISECRSKLSPVWANED